MLGNVNTSKQAWDTLSKMFTSKTRARIMHLKETLSRFTKGSQSISEYLHCIKALYDELSIINSPMDDVYLIIHTLNGLGSEYREVTTSLRTRENPIGFDDLHDLIYVYGSYLKRDTTVQETPLIATTNTTHKGRQFYNKTPKQYHNHTMPRSTPSGFSKRVVCQFCDKWGHTTKVFYKLHGYPPKNQSHIALHTRVMPLGASDWILDSWASYHITNKLDNLHLFQPYTGSYQLLVGDWSRHTISNISKIILKTPSQSFHLLNVLHVPKVTQKLLSVSSLCHTNPISIDFFSDHFLIKDLKTREPLLKGRLNNELYHMPHPSSLPQALVITTYIPPPWHHILGHPSDCILRDLLPSHKIKSQQQPCLSCNSVKSHKLPFFHFQYQKTKTIRTYIY